MLSDVATAPHYSFPDNVTSIAVKKILNIGKYLSLIHSQAVFTSLDKSRICLPNQWESHHLVNMYSTRGTALYSLRSLSYFTWPLFNYLKFTNEKNGSLARLSNWSRWHNTWPLRFRPISDAKAVTLNPGCTLEPSEELETYINWLGVGEDVHYTY